MNLSNVEHPGYDGLAPWTIREMHSPFKIPDVEEMKCPECGGIYKGLGCHFRDLPEHRPSMTQKQRDLVVGLLMGDGSLNRSGPNPLLKVGMVTVRYLEWLDERFGVLSTGVRLKETATEKARRNRESGFRPDAAAEDYQDLYRWRTRSLPELEEFNWYGSGGKVWPSDIDLTPTVLKHWYVGDGTWNNHGSHDRIRIAMSNEVDHQGKVDSYFEDVGLPTPSNYTTYERSRGGRMDCNAEFTKEDSRELFDYMGSPPPGFEYKWPEEYRQV